ncbi:MAG TPA: ATP-binding protein [Bacillota bacterium]|nr:ATP-binding protein [Bacillota bacterium]
MCKPNLIQVRSIQTKNDVIQSIEETKWLAKRCGFEDRDILFLQLAVEEACTNAYTHGKTGGEIKICWYEEPDGIHMEIAQEGKPFDFQRSDMVNVGEHGRGLYLIYHFMDKVWVHEEEQSFQFHMKKYLMDTERRGGL